jgi:hypothetical protein
MAAYASATSDNGRVDGLHSFVAPFGDDIVLSVVRNPPTTN